MTDVTSTDTTISATLVGMLKQADTNGDGIVSKSELEAAMGANSDLASELVSAADTDGDGAMSATEFASFAEKYSTQTGMSLLAAQESTASVAELYAELDSDGSGTLTASEITTAAAVTATTPPPDTAETEDSTSDTASDSSSDDSSYTYLGWSVDDMLKSVDVTGDGVYNKDDEYKRVLDADLEARQKRTSLAGTQSLDDLLYDVREALAMTQQAQGTSASD